MAAVVRGRSEVELGREAVLLADEATWLNKADILEATRVVGARMSAMQTKRKMARRRNLRDREAARLGAGYRYIYQDSELVEAHIDVYLQ